MPSQFGGIPVDEDAPKSKFGGVPVYNPPTAQASPPPDKTPSGFPMGNNAPPRNPGESNADYLMRNTYAGNMVTGAEESGVNIMQGSRWLGEKLYGKNPHDEAEKAAFEATNKKLAGQEGAGAGNFIARAAGDPLNYVAGGIGGKKVVEGAVKAGEGLGKGAKTLAEGYKARPIEELKKVSQGLGEESGQHYANMRASGVKIIPEKSSAIATDLEKELSSSGKLNEHLHGGTMAVLNDMKSNAAKGFDVEDLDQYRRRFSEIVSKSRLTGNQEDAFKAREAIDAIDEQFSKLKKGDVPKEAIDAIDSLKQGQAIWAKKKKFEAISEIVDKADGDPNRLKALFEQLKNNKKKMVGFTPEEKALIKAAAENNTAEGLLKMVGKLGITIGTGRAAATGNVLPALETIWGMTGGGQIAGGVVAAGTAAKYAQKLAAKAKAERVLQAIEGRPMPQINTGTPLNNVVKQIQ